MAHFKSSITSFQKRYQHPLWLIGNNFSFHDCNSDKVGEIYQIVVLCQSLLEYGLWWLILKPIWWAFRNTIEILCSVARTILVFTNVI